MELCIILLPCLYERIQWTLGQTENPKPLLKLTFIVVPYACAGGNWVGYHMEDYTIDTMKCCNLERKWFHHHFIVTKLCSTVAELIEKSIGLDF